MRGAFGMLAIAAVVWVFWMTWVWLRNNKNDNQKPEN